MPATKANPWITPSIATKNTNLKKPISALIFIIHLFSVSLYSTYTIATNIKPNATGVKSPSRSNI